MTGYCEHRNKLAVCEGFGSNSGATDDVSHQGYGTVSQGEKYLNLQDQLVEEEWTVWP